MPPPKVILGKRKNSQPLPAPNTKVSRISQAGARSCSQPDPARPDDQLLSMTQFPSAPVIQSSQDPNVNTCYVCQQSTSSSIQVDSLCCARCSRSFHGECLSIDISLLPFLHVVVDIGGWCCRLCCVPNAVIRGEPGIRDELNVVKTQVCSINDNIKSLSATIQTLTSLVHHSKPSYAETVHQQAGVSSGSGERRSNARSPPTKSTSNQTSGTATQVIPQMTPDGHPQKNVNPHGSTKNEFRAAVLAAVHSEFKTQSLRSSNIVVSGLRPDPLAPDADLFKQLCFSSLSIHTEVVKTSRLGALKEGRIQHLLVTLSKPADASYLLSIARSLRTVSDPYVRNNVYFNKHFTPAEGRAAYESRVLRRTRSSSTANPHLRKGDGSSSSDSSHSSNVHPMPGTDTDRITSNIVDCMSVDPSDQPSTSVNNILTGSC